MLTSLKRPHARTAELSGPHPAAGHCQPTPPPEIPGHSQACLGQSLLGSLLFATEHDLKQWINPTYFKMF